MRGVPKGAAAGPWFHVPNFPVSLHPPSTRVMVECPARSSGGALHVCVLVYGRYGMFMYAFLFGYPVVSPGPHTAHIQAMLM